MGMPRFSRRFCADRRGVSAVEFALIAPLLILAYVGTVQTTLALSADRKVTGATNAIADLVAQNDAVDAGTLADIFAAGRALVLPYASDRLEMRVTSLRADAAGTVEFLWSEGNGMPARSAGDLPPIPAGVLLPEAGVVVVETRYPYETPFADAGFGRFNFAETVYMRPRRSPTVERGDASAPPAGGGDAGGGSTPAPEAPTSGTGGDSGSGSQTSPGNNGNGNGNGNGRGRGRG